MTAVDKDSLPGMVELEFKDQYQKVILGKIAEKKILDEFKGADASPSDNKLSKDEWTTSKKSTSLLTKEQLEKLFDKIDDDKDGSVDFEKFK